MISCWTAAVMRTRKPAKIQTELSDGQNPRCSQIEKKKMQFYMFVYLSVPVVSPFDKNSISITDNFKDYIY